MMKLTWLSVMSLALILSRIGVPGEPSVVISPVNSASDLDLSGNIVYAVNFGNNGNPNVGGYLFSQDEDYPALTLDITGEALATSWGPAAETGDDDLNELLNGLAFVYPAGTTSINAGGLVIGMQYLLQLISYEPEQPGRRVDIVVENEEIVTYYDVLSAQGGVVGHGGAVLKYTFTATDPVLNIRIEPYGRATGINGLILTLETCPYSLTGDLNDDCRVDFLDFALMADNWLTDCVDDPDDPGCQPK